MTLGQELKTTWKAIAVIAAIFITGAAFAGYIGLPARVDALETKVNSLSAMVRQNLCLSRAEFEKTNWRDCLVPGERNDR
jgi:hypothetical protein